VNIYIKLRQSYYFSTSLECHHYDYTSCKHNCPVSMSFFCLSHSFVLYQTT